MLIDTDSFLDALQKGIDLTESITLNTVERIRDAKRIQAITAVNKAIERKEG